MSNHFKTFFSSSLSRLWLTAHLHPHKEPPDGWTLLLSSVHRVPFVIYSFLPMSPHSRLHLAPFTLLSICHSLAPRLTVAPPVCLSTCLSGCLQLCWINASIWRSELILEVTQPHTAKLRQLSFVEVFRISLPARPCVDSPPQTSLFHTKWISRTEHSGHNALFPSMDDSVFTSVHARQRKIHAYLISFLLRKSAGAKVTRSDKALFFFFFLNRMVRARQLW